MRKVELTRSNFNRITGYSKDYPDVSQSLQTNGGITTSGSDDHQLTISGTFPHRDLSN
jgi:hypothetical protein